MTERVSLLELSAARFVDKGDNDYDVELPGGAVIELSYDGDDIRVGTFTFWNLKLGNDRVGGTQIVAPHSHFGVWLEQQLRSQEAE